MGELRERTAEYKNNNKGIEVLSSSLFHWGLMLYDLRKYYLRE